MSMTAWEQRAVNGRWWAASKAERGRDLFGLCRYLRTAEGQRQRRDDDRHHMRLYGNMDAAGTAQSPRDKAIESLAATRGTGRMRYNLVQSAVDTAASVIAQQRPRPMFLTSGGRFNLQRKARLLTRAIEGQFYDLKVYDSGPMVFLDGAILGTGTWHGYLDEDGKPKIRRVLPMQMLVDHDSALDADPNERYEIYTVSRDELIARFPKFERELKTSDGPDQAAREDLFLTRDTKADRVLVCEGWHRPSRRGAKDGRHVVAVSNATLLDEPFTRRRLPYSDYRWAQRQVGFWGRGLVECGRDPQWRINRLIARYERQNNKGAGFYLMVDGNAKVRTEAITNTDGEIIRYYGARPEFLQAPGAHPSIAQEILDIREQFFSEQGISQMTAEGKKPAGLDSAPAQRTYDDLNTRRHIMNARAFEAAHMDLADLLMDLNDQAAELDENYTVGVRTQRGRLTVIESMRWKDLQVDAGDLRLQMFPTSALPTTPAGKMQAVQEWIATGFVSRPFAMQLLDFPDIDAAARYELADLDFAMWQVEEIIDAMIDLDERGETDRRPVVPDEYSNLEMCADIARRARLQCVIDGAPESVLQALADHADACLEAAQRGAQALLAAQQPQPAMPNQALAAPPAVQMGGAVNNAA